MVPLPAKTTMGLLPVHVRLARGMILQPEQMVELQLDVVVDPALPTPLPSPPVV